MLFTDLPTSFVVTNPSGSPVTISRVGTIAAGANRTINLNLKLETKRLAIWKAVKSAVAAGVLNFVSGADAMTGTVRYKNISGGALTVAGRTFANNEETDVVYGAMTAGERNKVFKTFAAVIAAAKFSAVDLTLADPTVTSILPTTGPTAGGTAVTISGDFFLAGATVTIGGVAATSVVVVNDNTITAVTPATTAGAKNIVVTNPNTQFGTLVAGFTYA